MINHSSYSNFKPQKPSGERMTLPAGVYVGKIVGAKIDHNQTFGDSYGQVLSVMFEIAEGEYAGFYRRQYDEALANNSGQYAVKHKGVYKFYFSDEAAKPDQQRLSREERAIAGFAWALEESNEGYHWDWEEGKLKGLTIGLNVRERDWALNGRTGTTTEIGGFESVPEIRQGKVKVMKKRELSQRDKQQLEAAQREAGGMTEVTDEELPF